MLLRRTLYFLLVCILVVGTVSANEAPTLELIMSDADWIGNAPENPWWADDGSAEYFEQKRDGENIRDRSGRSLLGALRRRPQPGV